MCSDDRVPTIYCLISLYIITAVGNRCYSPGQCIAETCSRSKLRCSSCIDGDMGSHDRVPTIYCLISMYIITTGGNRCYSPGQCIAETCSRSKLRCSRCIDGDMSSHDRVTSIDCLISMYIITAGGNRCYSPW